MSNPQPSSKAEGETDWCGVGARAEAIFQSLESFVN